jgi:hypothetical protein
VRSVAVDGAQSDVTSPSGLSLGFQDDDPSLGAFDANVYDPDTERPRALVLRTSP